ncbi:hypothetical protein BpHYR1_001457 [Brachionus plicatilis]|uniref:Uncharacterized protein n=1 Tax=Brachionus plicatilis TaxID=10195 RepID=A0A3M7T4S3_BRAPC|nr:hypothetical protein BpHYR1_001457 [Brachionus plicatilis]
MVNRHLFSTSSILLKFLEEEANAKAKPIWIKLRFKISKLADPKGQQIQLIEMDKRNVLYLSRQIEVHDQIF